MTVLSIARIFTPGYPSIVFLHTDDTIEDMVTTGYITNNKTSITAANNGEFEWQLGDTVLVVGGDDVPFWCSIFNEGFGSLIPIFPLNPVLGGITAHAGGGQANATQINIGFNSVSTVATTGDSVKLPDNVLSQTVVVFNGGANSLNLFPFLGDSINLQAVNTSIAVPSGSTASCYGVGVTQWSVSVS